MLSKTLEALLLAVGQLSYNDRSSGGDTDTITPRMGKGVRDSYS